MHELESVAELLALGLDGLPVGGSGVLLSTTWTMRLG